MVDSSASRGPGQSLSASERETLSTRALELSGRGASKAQIGRELEISTDTVKRLLVHASKGIAETERDSIRATIEASVNAVKRRAWTELDRRHNQTDAQKRRNEQGSRIIQPTSHTLPALLSRILEADDRLIRLYGLDQPDANATPTESLAEQMIAYEEAKRTGKVSDIGAKAAGNAS